MAQIRIVVENTGVLDLDSDFSPRITVAIEDYFTLGKSSSKTTHQTEIPYTKNNADILGRFETWSEVNSQGQNTWLECYNEIDGNVVFVGNVTLQGITFGDSFKPKKMKIQAVGEISNWKLSLNGKYMNGLDLGDVTYSETAITNSWSATASTSDVVYGLVNFGKWQGGTGDRVLVEDFRPAIYERNAVKAIFNEIGWQVDGDWINDTEGLKNTQLACGSKFLHSPEKREHYSFDAEISSSQNMYVLVTGQPQDWGRDLHLDTVNADPSSLLVQYTPTGGVFYTQLEPSQVYKSIFRGKIEYTLTAGTSPSANNDVEIRVYVSPQSGTDIEIGSQDVTIADLVPYTGSFSFESEEVSIDSSDVYRIYVTASNVTGGLSFLNNVSVDVFEIEAEHVPEIQKDQDYDLAYGAFKPGLTQLDFIRGLIHADGLLILTNPLTKTVTIDKREDFYDEFGEVEDWTHKVEDGEIEIISDGKKTRRFCFKNDSSDKYTGLLQRVSGGKLYSADFTLGDTFTEGVEEIENPYFAATTHIYDYVLENPAENDGVVYIPRIWGDDWDGGDYPEQFSADFEPRRLYYKGLVTQPGSPEWIFEGTARAQVPSLFQVNYNDTATGTSDPNLGFGDEVVMGGTATGQAKLNYLSYIAQRLDNFVLEVSVRLSPTEFSNLDFSKPKRINGANFLLLRVKDYDFRNIDPTTAILVRVAPKTQNVFDAISSAGIDGSAVIVE